MLLQQRLQPEQRLNAIHHRRPPPLDKRPLRHFHRSIHVRRRRKRNLRQHLGRRGIDHVQRIVALEARHPPSTKFCNRSIENLRLIETEM